MKIRMILIISILLLSLAALAVFTGKNKGGTVVIADVNEILDNPKKFRNRELRVRGRIKPGSVIRYGDRADFILSYKGKDLKVRFDGSTQLPDTFADGAPARADGTLNEKMELISDKVEAKCASKYETVTPLE